MEKKIIRGKKNARKLAVQALYQWQLSGTPTYEIEAQFLAINNMQKVDSEYFSQLLKGVATNKDAIDACFLPFLDREVKSLNPIELVVLRLGTYEFMYCPELPYKIVLDEAVSLAKAFGAQDGYKYVNGVLNQVAEKVRSFEKN